MVVDEEEAAWLVWGVPLKLHSQMPASGKALKKPSFTRVVISS